MEILIKKPNSEIEERGLSDAAFNLLRARSKANILLSCRLTGDYSKKDIVNCTYQNFNFIESYLLNFSENREQKNVTVNIYNLADDLIDSIDVYGDIAIVTSIKTFAHFKQLANIEFNCCDSELLKKSSFDVIEDLTNAVDLFDFVDSLGTFGFSVYPFRDFDEFKDFAQFIEQNPKIFRGTKDEVEVKDGRLAFKTNK